MPNVTPYAENGGYTKVDNALIDYVMPMIDASDWKVLCFILRKTRGWHKESDKISLSQIVSGTGLSKGTAIKSTKTLEEGGHIIVDRTNNINQICLNASFVIVTENMSKICTGTNSALATGTNSEPSASTKFVHTKETPTKEKEKESPPPVATIKTPTHIANMVASQETLPPAIQAIADAIREVTLNTNAARINEAAYELYGRDADADEIRRLFQGKGSWFMEDGPGAWGNTSRPNVGNITNSILIARDWESQRTTPAQTAQSFLLIQAIQAKGLQNGAMKAEVQALPVDVRLHLQAATNGNWSRVNTLTPEQWQAATPKG